MTNKEIETLYTGIQSLRERADLRLPARVSFTLIRGNRILLPLVQDQIEARSQILEKYGKPIGNGQYQIPPENTNKVTTEIKNLEEIDISVELPKLKMKDLEDLDLSLAEAEALYLLLEEED